MADPKPTSFAERLARFPAEWREFWRSLPLRWACLALGILWIVWFAIQGNSTLGYVNSPSLFTWWIWVHTRGVFDEDGSFNLSKFVNSDTIHVWFVPLVVFLLIWSRRSGLMALPKRIWWPAMAVFVVALLFHLTGFIVQQTRLSIVGFVTGIYALMGLFWGRAWLRETLFPFLLFAFCVPVPNGGEMVTFPLRRLSSEASVAVSNYLLGLNVVCVGTQIFSVSGRFQYDVAPACSGIRSLQTLLAITAIYGYFSFSKLWKRLFILFLAFPMAVAGNVLRITSAILVGEVFGEKAGVRIEQPMGLLTFPLALLALFAIGHWLREKPAVPMAPESEMVGARHGEPSQHVS